jgi:hypothetical protein
MGAISDAIMASGARSASRRGRLGGRPVRVRDGACGVVLASGEEITRAR